MSATHVRFAVLALSGLLTGAMTALALLPEARERLLPSPGVKSTGRALVGGPFALTDHTGKRVADADFRGRIMLILFGSTSSADFTPSALQVVSAALDRLGTRAQRFVPILITVDPERDTPERLNSYVAGFHPRLVGLTGTPAEIAAVLRAYRVQGVRRREDDKAPGGYAMDYPPLIYAMDADGRFRTLVSFSAGVDAVAASLVALL